jgi:uncharacterized phage protein (TIGR02218 family)
MGSEEDRVHYGQAMKTIHADLLTYLNANKQFLICDLLTMALVSGNSYYYTNADRNIGVYLSTDVQFSRSRVIWRTGVQVSELQLEFYPKFTSTINSTEFHKACRAGALDGATITLQRAYYIIGAPMTWFAGRVAGDLEIARSKIMCTVKDNLELLSTSLPRNVFQPSCMHTLYDADCGLNRDNFSYGTTVAAANLNWIQTPLGSTFPPGTWNLGKIKFTSGANIGQSYTIRAYAEGQIALAKMMTTIPAAGDSLILYLGCDLQRATCQSRFNNLAHFRGFPDVPVPETVLPI